MSMTGIGIVAIDVLFALAVLTAASCLVYLVSLTVREHLALNALRTSSRAAGASAAGPVVSSVVRLADRRTARRGNVQGLRSGAVPRRAGMST